MMGFFGDPTSVLIKPEKPDFFLKTLGALASRVSSEYLFGPLDWPWTTCWAFSASDMAAGESAEKLVDWRIMGLVCA